MASTSRVTCKNFVTLSAVSWGLRKTSWYCTRLTFTLGLLFNQASTLVHVIPERSRHYGIVPTRIESPSPAKHLVL